MKKLLIAAILIGSIPATAAYALVGDCGSWSTVYAKTQPQCICSDGYRDRGGRKVTRCH